MPFAKNYLTIPITPAPPSTPTGIDLPYSSPPPYTRSAGLFLSEDDFFADPHEQEYELYRQPSFPFPTLPAPTCATTKATATATHSPSSSRSSSPSSAPASPMRQRQHPHHHCYYPPQAQQQSQQQQQPPTPRQQHPHQFFNPSKAWKPHAEHDPLTTLALFLARTYGEHRAARRAERDRVNAAKGKRD